MFLKFYCHFHPLFEAKSSYVYKIDEDNKLEIVEMVIK
jgi:hypothetical protein